MCGAKMRRSRLTYLTFVSRQKLVSNSALCREHDAPSKEVWLKRRSVSHRSPGCIALQGLPVVRLFRVQEGESERVQVC